MFFRGEFRAGVEPVGVMRGSSGDGPFLHGHGDDACLLVIQLFLSLGGGEKLGVHILGKPLPHGLAVEHVLIEKFRWAFPKHDLHLL